MVLIFARTNFPAKKVQNARKLVPNLRSKGSARKLIRFKIISLKIICLIYYNYRAVHVIDILLYI